MGTHTRKASSHLGRRVACLFAALMIVGTCLIATEAANVPRHQSNGVKSSELNIKDPSHVSSEIGKPTSRSTQPWDGRQAEHSKQQEEAIPEATPAGADAETEPSDDIQAPSGRYLRRNPAFHLLNNAFDDLRFWGRPVASNLFDRLHVLSPFSSFQLISDIFGNFDDIAESSCDNGKAPRREFVSRVAIRELHANDSAVVYGIKLAGIPRENVTVSIDAQGVLRVEAVYEETHFGDLSDGAGEEGGVESTRKFKYVGQQQLSFGVDADQVQADYKDGLLRITIPKPHKDSVKTLNLS